MKRRNLIKCLATAAVAAPASMIATSHAADEPKKGKKAKDGDKEKIVDYLFVQNAAGATLKDGVLTLKGVAKDTLYFSDRPDRIAGRFTTAEFLDHWSKGADSFKKDPPNAVLTVIENPVAVDVVVVLKNPRLEAGNLIYDVDVTDGDKEVNGKASALFIDVIGRPLTPLSVAGVARRSARRTVRRR